MEAAEGRLLYGVQGLGRQQARHIESGKGKLWGWTSAAQKYDEIQIINELNRKRHFRLPAISRKNIVLKQVLNMFVRKTHSDVSI